MTEILFILFIFAMSGILWVAVASLIMDILGLKIVRETKEKEG